MVMGYEIFSLVKKLTPYELSRKDLRRLRRENTTEPAGVLRCGYVMKVLVSGTGLSKSHKCWWIMEFGVLPLKGRRKN